jgi:hypothetical protein
MKALVFFLLLAFSLTTHAQSANEVAARTALLWYNDRSPITVKEVSSERRADITVRDITFSPGPGRAIKAYLVVPREMDHSPVYCGCTGSAKRNQTGPSSWMKLLRLRIRGRCRS